MKKTLLRALTLSLSAAILFGCEKEEDVLLNESMALQATTGTCDKISFENYAPGFLTQVQSTGGHMIGVKSIMRAKDGTIVTDRNYAMLQHTGTTTEHDMKSTTLGNVLIINKYKESDAVAPGEEFITTNPWGGTIEVDFAAAAPVNIKSLDVIDIDSYESPSKIELLGQDGKPVHSMAIPVTGEGGIGKVTFNGSNGIGGVWKVRVYLDGMLDNNPAGSGGIDNIEFCRETETPSTPGVSCTRTQGYWKTHAEKGSKKYDSTWDAYINKTFYLSGMNYLQVLQEAPKGNAYYILAHQFIAAELNKAAGAALSAADDEKVWNAFTQASEFFSKYSPQDVKGNKDLHAKATAMAAVLADYNEGKIGPGHCD
ncbi:hypothetical protein OB13_03325 [Pontibacter sp. HJ8]